MPSSHAPRGRRPGVWERARAGVRARAGALAVGGALLLAGCSGAAPDDPAPATSAPRTTPSGTTPTSTTPTGTATTSATAAPGNAPAAPPAAATTPPVVAEETLPPVPLGTPARFGEGLAVTVVSREDTTVTATLPGEVSGPGTLLRLTFRNGSATPVDLDGLRVAVADAAGDPASSVDGPPAQPPTGLLAPGASASGTWAYTLPEGASGALTVQVTSTGSADVVVVRA